jgi:peptidoglycan/LPS O-acetylase OafA/YrhL
MRGVAAIAVAILHMPRVFGGVTLPNAHLAVDFFLQLSGFIVAYAYAERIRGGMSFRDFAARRFNRLYPAYLVGFALGVAVAVTALLFSGNGLSVDWTPFSAVCSALFNVVMLPQPNCGGEGLLFPFNPPMWTIFYEVVLNFLFFIAVAFLVKWKNSAGLAVVALVITVLLTNPGTLDIGYSWSTFLSGFVRLTFSFLVGVAIHGLALKWRRQSSVIAVVVLAVLALSLTAQVDSYLYEIVAIVLIFPAVVMLGSMFNPTHRALSWVLTQLGVVSYVLYVIHKPVYQLAYAGILKFSPNTIDILGAALGVSLLAGIVVVAWTLGRYYEPWARRLLDRSTRPRRRAMPPARA